MITDLLDASRIRAGERISLKFQECDLSELTDQIMDDLSSIHGSRFELELAEEVTGFWSPEGLRRVIENLVGNEVSLSVHNEGEPISTQNQEKLFTAFSRGESTQVIGKKGWGLGLTLVGGIAEAHGGTVKVESSEEEGTTFTVILQDDSRTSQDEESD